ncbi:MAG: ATP-binding protein [Planctomycetes bacterium]|nr:ATP-binding protein [Planctomycetota bacterium]
MTTLRREMTIPNETKHLATVRQTAMEVLELTPFDTKTRSKIVVAVDEALANVVEHAYQGGQGNIELVFDVDVDRLQVIIRDNGVRFEPADGALKTSIDIHHHIKLGLKGGLGMFLMRQIMDEVQYLHETPWTNELIMVKRFGARDGAGAP